MKYVCVAVRGHVKGAFTMLLTAHIELFSSSEAIYFDEVVGEIDSSKDDIEALRPLAFILRNGFLNCNICSPTGNMHMSIGMHEKKGRIFFLTILC